MANLEGAQAIYSMIESIKFDESIFFESWRFNSADCLMSHEEKQRLVFLDSEQTGVLWREHISATHTQFMLLPRGSFTVSNSQILDFKEVNAGRHFFQKTCPDVETVIFFWGSSCACIAPMEIVASYWTDFFYPSDEDSIISIPNSKQRIFSFEEKFFNAISNF